MATISSSSKILIVGSGVFGISTALWLARSGYGDVTVLDMQDTANTAYDPSCGVDSASADLNKIIRFSYGSEIEYQRLATEASKMWDEWNREIEEASINELPERLRYGDRKLWWNAGMLRMSCESDLGDFEIATLENMEREGIREFQFIADDDIDISRARERGWAHKLDPCRRQERFGTHKAVLDSTAGFVYAHKSCAWAQHLAKRAGVEMILDPRRGKVIDITTTNNQPVVHTADGLQHTANIVVVAGGGWTPSLIPEVQGLLETTAGSVANVTIPKDRPDLWKRFAPEIQPVITWGSRQGKEVYSLPRDENGTFKIGWRKTKWTNFEDVREQRISVPRTAHVTDHKETRIPIDALNGIKEYISVNFPELVPLGITSTRLCWYTDSIDNSFVVDFVPGRPGVAVCSGGSGHGFKFLPILGREVVKILEGKGSQTVYGRMWRWRSSSDHTRNGLEEGEEGWRVLSRQTMASEADWSFKDQ
ncbi:FAD dependent oxidoreductase [Annulohypoxylon maeteangense]|uniref:FAD dependent oxidoreductase n=1 Tax=Annulohypoxylon maeteangense TaxID=1927788 RepID=UPI002007B44B|nr:FAD dependent oxidoreductase [Annulohypoxylon maeteangense]KAI0879981.1 FAD dependent oxidoreductase [Annulohypoxylon maeteangense]